MDTIPSRRDYSYANLALSQTKLVRGKQRNKLGAVVIKGGRVLALGRNNYTNCRHAEVNALRKVPESDRSGTILFVVRMRRDQRWGLAKPCSNCHEFLRAHGVKRVYYSNNECELSWLDF